MNVSTLRVSILIAQHSPTSSQVDRQQYVRLSRLHHVALLREAARHLDYLKGSSDSTGDRKSCRADVEPGCKTEHRRRIHRVQVIYGDTDSIMIYTNTDNLSEVKIMGQKLKAAVNKKYKLLEIEMDGFFRRMLLLKKKKYAALTAIEGEGGKLILSRETKGLDLVRRDWCGLSKEVSQYVIIHFVTPFHAG